MAVQASWVLEACFDKSIAGILTFGRSTFDGTDVFSEAPPGLFDGTYADLTDDVDSDIVVTRGRTDFLGANQQGTLTVDVCRPSDPTFWDPNSPSSPIYRGTVDPGFVPMRPIRLRGTYNGVTKTRFYGFIRTATYNPDTRVCSISCEDLILWLSRVDEPSATYTSSTTGAVIGKLLDQAQWTDPTMRQLATGDAIATLTLDGSLKVTDEITALLTAERGQFYIRGDGVAMYDDRHTKWGRSSVATFSDVAVEFVSGIDLDNIKNRGSVSDGVATTSWEDDASIQAYGPSDATAINSPLVANVAGLAAWMDWQLASPDPPLRVTVEADSQATLTGQLTVDLQQKITIAQSLSGIPSGDYFVEQITDTIGEAGALLTSQYLVSPVGVGVLIFDTSTYDSPAVFDY